MNGLAKNDPISMKNDDSTEMYVFLQLFRVPVSPKGSFRPKKKQFTQSTICRVKRSAFRGVLYKCCDVVVFAATAVAELTRGELY